MIRYTLLTAVSLAFFACGGANKPEPLKPNPWLIVDRDSIGFGLEFNRLVYVGTKPQESLRLENGGLEDLVINNVALSGDDVFTIEGPTKTTIKGRELAFIRIIFAPTEAKLYNGAITISSNAANDPEKIIGLSGRGALPDAGP